jgi:enoyl-CoA hydratase/carnithine racemase
MAYEFLLIDESEAVVTVTMNRPEKRNAMNNAVKGELRAVAVELDGRDDISCVILTGAGSAFSAGNDLSDPRKFSGDMPLAEARRVARLGADMCTAWESLRALTIAVVQGPAIGGALSLAVACDFRILGPMGYFHATEVELGLSYTWNSLPRIGNLVGPARAKLVGALARKIDAPTALAWGLCEQLAEAPMDAAHAMAAEIARLPRIAQQMVKESVNRHFAAPNTVYLDQDQILVMAREPETIRIQERRREQLGRGKAAPR